MIKRRAPRGDEVREQPLRLEEPPISVVVRRTTRCRRLTMSLCRLSGDVRVSAPHGVADGQIRRFVEEHADWLRNALRTVRPPIPMTIGAEAPFQGVMRPIVAAAGPAAARLTESGEIAVGGSAAGAPARVMAWMKDCARAELSLRARRHANALGVRFERLSIRDTRSRWGSCSSAGALSFSWRLILAPIDVLDYVAAHEVAHLLEMNHSPRFWAHVARLCPEWRRRRDWLRENGAELHRYVATSAVA